MQVVRSECLRETQDNLDPFGRSTRMYLTNIRSSVDANGKPHRTHRMSRAGASGDSTTTILYSAMQLGQWKQFAVKSTAFSTLEGPAECSLAVRCVTPMSKRACD